MFNNFGLFDQQEIQKIAWEALQKQEKQFSREESRIKLIEEREYVIDYGAAIFEEYNQDMWSDKVRRDSNIYNTILSKVEENTMDKIQFILADLLGSVNSIYEHVNINPESYGFKNLNVEASESELHLESMRILDNFFNKHYYSLTKNEKDKLYMERSLNLATDIILKEEIEIVEAVEHVQKTIIVDKLLEEINFPKPVFYRIQELMSNQIYGEIFEQEELVDKWNDFKNKSFSLARVFAALI